MQLSLLHALRLFALFALLGLIGIVVLVQVYGHYGDFPARADRLRADYVAQQKQLMRREVEHITDRVRYRKSVLVDIAAQRARARVEQAVAIADNIYRHNLAQRPAADIQERIVEALRAIRFEQGVGYFFVVDLTGHVILHPDRPELEGTDVIDLTDSHGRPFIRALVNQVKAGHAGDFVYTFSKPNRTGDDYVKVSHVAGFDPYQWMIGTGIYLDDLEQEEKQSLLGEINQVRYGKNGYLFVADWDGRVLANGAQPELIGANVWDVVDANGVRVVQELIAAAQTQHGDFVHYIWRKPGSDKEHPKVSFAKGIEDWRWMIGSGLYTDDIEEDIARLQEDLRRRLTVGILRIIAGAGIIALLVFLLMNRLYRTLLSDFSTFQRFFNQAATSDQAIAKAALHFSEFRQQADFANRMLSDKIAAQLKLEHHRAQLEDEIALRTRGLEEKTRQLEQARD